MLTTENRKIPFDAAGGNLLATSASGSDDRAHSFTIGHTWVLNSTMVNSLRVLGNDVLGQKPGPQFLNLQDVGINAFTYVPGYVSVTVNGGFNLGSGSFVSNVVTKIRLTVSAMTSPGEGGTPVRLRRSLSLVKVGHGRQWTIDRSVQRFQPSSPATASRTF
jgi:hypothetical protein